MLLLDRPWTRQPKGAAEPSESAIERGLKLLVVPSIGQQNLVYPALAVAQSGTYQRGVVPTGIAQIGNSNATEHSGLTLNITRGLTLVGIWRSRPSSQYLASDLQRYLVSSRTAGNAGWSWGRDSASGGGDAGNVTRQSLVLQGAASYSESTYSIESLVDTPVACRYNKVTGTISWFRSGAKSSSDTAGSTGATTGGPVVVGAQGPYGAPVSYWLDQYSVVAAFEGAQDDEYIQRITSSPRALWATLFRHRRIWVPVSAGSDVAVSLSGAAVAASAGGIGSATSAPIAGSAGLAAAGSLTAGISLGVNGAAVSSAAGSLTPSLSVALAGVATAASAGTVSTGNDVAVALSGSQVAASAGALAVSSAVALAGQAATYSAGQLTAGLSLALSGSSVLALAGSTSPSVNNDVVVALAGAESEFAAGAVAAIGGSTASRLGGFEMVGHTPSRRLWWVRKPKELDEEEAEEALEEAAEAIVETVAKEVAKKSEPKKVRKAVKEAIKPAAEKMPGFDWTGLFQQALAAAQESEARTQAAIRDHIVRSLLEKERRRIEEDDEEIELLAMML